ncbi:MAG: helix-turn-helix transcriptional regulator [Rikenellaceae bacterium]
MTKIIENIREIRLQRGITQEYIADALSVDASVISNIEKGKRELRVSELEKIASALNVDMLYLFTYPKTYVDREMFSRDGSNNGRVSITVEIGIEQRDLILQLLNCSKEK